MLVRQKLAAISRAVLEKKRCAKQKNLRCVKINIDYRRALLTKRQKRLNDMHSNYKTLTKGARQYCQQKNQRRCSPLKSGKCLL